MEKIVVLGNGSDWCDISLTDLHHQENCLILNDDLPCSTKSILGRLAWIHYSRKINKIIKLPLKNMWFPYFAKYIAAKCDDKLYIIIYDRHRLANNEAFLVYIKKRYTNVKLIYVFTNIVSISGAKENKFIEKLNDYYDVVYAFDPSDVPRYQFKYSPLIYSRYDVCKEKNDGSIFYVGRAKDRYGFLMDV